MILTAFSAKICYPTPYISRLLFVVFEKVYCLSTQYKILPYPGADWLHTPDSPIQTILTQDWPILLDSSQASTPTSGRFDIVTANPFIKLKQTHQITLQNCLTQQTRTFSIRQHSALQLLKQQLQQYASTPSPTLLPFTGGALGYFSYDLGKSFEHITPHASDDMQCPDMAVGIYDWTYIVDHQAKQAYLVKQGHDPRDDFAALEALVTEAVTTTTQCNNRFALTSQWQSNFTLNSYQAAFKQVQQHIREGDCYQINLAQRFTASYTGHPWHAYQQLSRHNAAPFGAYIHFDDLSILSLSPERFLSVQKGQVETKPIKGTRPRSPDIEQDAQNAQQLQQSVKDRAENVMIVDLLRNDLSHNCALGSVKVPKLFEIESYPAVHHLVSTVTGQLRDDQHALDLLQASFPGGSITGAPKIMAMQIIEQLEPHRRAIYCGSIGYIDFNGNMDTNIAIRTLLCQSGHVYCWGGGGLVADSEATAEYQETLDKVNKILPLLKPNSPV